MIWKGEYLEDATVKGDQVLLDQSISGFQVVIEAHLQKRAEFVVAVEGKPMAVGDENEQEIEQELMVRKSTPEPVPEESVFNGGEASLNGT